MLKFELKGKKNISLIGLMGSGKSIIGKDISKIYNIDFYDSDKEIESITGKSINNIFTENGEKYFREIEEKTCLELLKKNNCIISLGGGSIISQKVRKYIYYNSYCIYLKTNINILVERLNKSNKRPLLNNVDKKSKLMEIYNSRKEYYNNADLIINNNFNRKELIKEIKSKISYK
jgi:Shikimate kinase